MSEQMRNARHICMISGGKDSTALALYLRQTRPDLRVEYVFCDTHKELQETYEYLTKIEAFLEQPIVRLCSEYGERGFDHWLQMYRGFLPSPSVRWCTRMLKIKPFEDFIGEDPAYLYVGIRADENRSGYISSKPTIVPIFPFKEAGLKINDVARILNESGLGFPDYYSWRSRSGCFFCFYQRKSEWLGLKEHHPDLFEEAKKYERPDEGYTWVQGESLDEMTSPERAARILAEEEKRKARSRKTRKPQTLSEVFAPDAFEVEDDSGCSICHL